MISHVAAVAAAATGRLASASAVVPTTHGEAQSGGRGDGDDSRDGDGSDDAPADEDGDDTTSVSDDVSDEASIVSSGSDSSIVARGKQKLQRLKALRERRSRSQRIIATRALAFAQSIEFGVDDLTSPARPQRGAAVSSAQWIEPPKRGSGNGSSSSEPESDVEPPASSLPDEERDMRALLKDDSVIATWPPMVLQYALPWQQHFNKTLKTMAPSAGGKPSLSLKRLAASTMLSNRLNSATSGGDFVSPSSGVHLFSPKHDASPTSSGADSPSHATRRRSSAGGASLLRRNSRMGVAATAAALGVGGVGGGVVGGEREKERESASPSPFSGSGPKRSGTRFAFTPGVSSVMSAVAGFGDVVSVAEDCVSDRSGSVGSVGSDAATFHSGLVASMMALQRATDSSGVQLAGLRLNTTRAFAFQPGEWQFMRVKLPQVSPPAMISFTFQLLAGDCVTAYISSSRLPSPVGFDWRLQCAANASSSACVSVMPTDSKYTCGGDGWYFIAVYAESEPLVQSPLMAAEEARRAAAGQSSSTPLNDLHLGVQFSVTCAAFLAVDRDSPEGQKLAAIDTAIATVKHTHELLTRDADGVADVVVEEPQPPPPPPLITAELVESWQSAVGPKASLQPEVLHYLRRGDPEVDADADAAGNGRTGARSLSPGATAASSGPLAIFGADGVTPVPSSLLGGEESFSDESDDDAVNRRVDVRRVGLSPAARHLLASPSRMTYTLGGSASLPSLASPSGSQRVSSGGRAGAGPSSNASAATAPGHTGSGDRRAGVDSHGVAAWRSAVVGSAGATSSSKPGGRRRRRRRRADPAIVRAKELVKSIVSCAGVESVRLPPLSPMYTASAVR